MLAILQILLSIIITILYSVNISIQLDVWGILGILLIFIVANLAVILVFLLFFVAFIYATEKVSPKAMWKHYVIHHFNMYLFRFFYRVKLVVTGKENMPTNNKFVIYSNHIEYSDPFFVMQTYKKFPIAFVAKEPLFEYIVLKNILRGTGCLPLSRFADRSALKTILQAIKQVKEGQPMAIFPEAKRTYSNDPIEFKPGAFKLAQKANADIAPICLYNVHALAKKMRILPTKIYLHILPIIKYEEYKDLETNALSEMVFEQINGQMNKFKNNQE